jgi:predicted glycosyltransferase
MIVVTHLLGAGHLTRAAALARAFAAAGHQTTLVSGGLPAPLIPLDGVRLVQLPPVRTIGTDFKTLLDEAGTPVDPERLEERRALLLDTLQAVRPDVLVTELFPFGRRGLAGEFLPLLEAARALEPRPLVACSVRDILVAPTKPARIAEAHKRLAALYDLVLVHGDPDLVPLEASWPLDEAARGLLRYTGYVDDGTPSPEAGERRGILVSGGSSAASLPLYRASLDAAGALPDQPWRILIGNGVPESDFADLRHAAPANASVERARRDFRPLLSRAAVSVSQCGYNTAIDVLRTGVSAVFVPFEGGHETEQRLRAERLQARGLGSIVPESGLSAARLVDAVRDALVRQPSRATLNLDGAAESVRIVEGALKSPALQTPHASWAPLDAALARAEDTGRTVSFWWRDDDAVAPTSALDRLLDLAGRYRIPLAIAAIPTTAEPSLAEHLGDAPNIAILVHGLGHTNHAHEGSKKAEFGAHRPLAEAVRDAQTALALGEERFGPCFLPVFVPPWNRIAPELVPSLAKLGYRGLSTFNDRAQRMPAPGLVQINTHIDPIHWHGTRSARPLHEMIALLARAIEARLGGRADPDEPIGLLTHHLVHDEAVWHLCESLVERLSRSTLVRYPFASQIFFDPASRVAIEP